MHCRILLLRCLLLMALCGSSWMARASGCVSAQPAGTGVEAARIAAIACRENTLWYSPFIDANGRLASNTVSEAESARLSDGATPAWMRVVEYWRGSGLLPRMQQFAGASDCSYVGGGGYSSPQCRAFVIDQPWSAAFISWVMVQGGLPGFNPTASHFGYVSDAFRGGDSPFRFADPDQVPASVGDLLCYVRSNATQLGFGGLSAFIARGGPGALNMHCDVVVAVQPGMLSLVGGNVLQGVTMRLVATNRNGLPWNLPRGTGANTSCWPSNPDGCSFNRHDWSVLMKLRPDAELATLPAAMQVPGSPIAPPPSQACCTNCVVGSGIPRCPNPNAPSVLPQGSP